MSPELHSRNHQVAAFLEDLANRYRYADTTPSGSYQFVVPGLRFDAKIKIRTTGLPSQKA